MPEEGYNGWSNYATWAVHQWLTNDPAIRDKVNQVVHGRVPDERLSEWVENEMWQELLEVNEDDVPHCLGSDLLTWAIGQVNWQELVTALKESEDALEELS